MNIFDIYSRLAVTDHLVPYMQGAASGLLLGLGILTLCFALFRAAVLDSGQDPLAWGLRFVLVLGCLAAYPQIVDGLITGSKELTAAFIDKAGYQEYWQHATDQFQPMFSDPAVAKVSSAGDSASRPNEPSTLDRTVGLLRGGVLTVCLSVAYGLQFWAFEMITNLAILFVSILRLLGPLMIAAGVIGDGRTLRQWLFSMTQVLLWPVVPPLFMMITFGAGGVATQTDNVVFSVCQSLMLTLFALATPLIVLFILGRGGVTAAVGAVTSLAAGVTVAGLRGLSTALGEVGHEGGSSGSSRSDGNNHGSYDQRYRPADAARPVVVNADPRVARPSTQQALTASRAAVSSASADQDSSYGGSERSRG